MAATAYGFAPMGGLKLGNAPRHAQLASSRRAPVAARSLINTRMAWNRDAGREVLADIKHEEVEEMFAKFDKGGDGNICEADLADALKEKGVVMSDYEFMLFMQEVDTNVDGLVCVEDFENAVREMKLKTGRETAPLQGTQTIVRNTKSSIAQLAEDTDAWREGQRRYRRTVFGPKDWIRYRRSTRLIDNLLSTFDSAVIRALWFDILIVTSVATGVFLWNHAIDDGVVQPAVFDFISKSTDLEMTKEAFAQWWKTSMPHAMLPTAPFSLSSPSLGLLLVFRTNGAFQRFFEARVLWGGVVNYSRNFVRQAVTHLPAHEAEEMGRRILCFPFALKFHLRYDEDVGNQRVKEFEKILGPKEAARFLTAGHKPCQALTDISNFARHSSASPLALQQFDRSLEQFSNQAGACERIFKTPLPLLYTRHTSRFLTIWCLMLPFCLYKELGGSPVMIPIAATISAFLLGIEELGVQIAEPFSVLPLENICNGIQGACTQMLNRGIPDAQEGWKDRWVDSKDAALKVVPDDFVAEVMEDYASLGTADLPTYR